MKEIEREASAQKKDTEEKLPIPDELENELDKRIGNLVSRSQKEQIIKQISGLLIQAEMYQGPFPHPRHVSEYEKFCPGFLDRSLKMAEKANDSNIENNRKIIEYQIEDAKRGMRYGLIALIGLIIAALICVLTGHEIMAGVFLGVSVVGVIGKFILGRFPEHAKD